MAGYRKLSRTAAQRKALIRAQVTSLLQHGKIVTTEAKAKEIRAAGDAAAAKYYSVFKQNPELAVFLRKLESLRVVMRGRTTLVFDTNTAPFDLFKPGAEVLGPVKSQK